MGITNSATITDLSGDDDELEQETASRWSLSIADYFRENVSIYRARRRVLFRSMFSFVFNGELLQSIESPSASRCAFSIEHFARTRSDYMTSVCTVILLLLCFRWAAVIDTFVVSSFSFSGESQGTPATVYNFDYDDERRALRDELDKFRRENEFLRQSVLLNKNKSPHAEEREKLLTTTPPTVGQSMQTATSASVDSGFDASTPGMSSTFRSNTALQFELNNLQERERKLQEQVNSLRRVSARRWREREGAKRKEIHSLAENFSWCFRSNLSQPCRKRMR